MTSEGRRVKRPAHENVTLARRGEVQLLPHERLRARQGEASLSVSPSRGEELRLMSALENSHFWQKELLFFRSEVALASGPADSTDEEGVVSPSVQRESESVACAAHTGLADLSESEDETMG